MSITQITKKPLLKAFFGFNKKHNIKNPIKPAKPSPFTLFPILNILSKFCAINFLVVVAGLLQKIQGYNIMRKEYDFSNSAKNPYVKKLKQQISIRIEKETINILKEYLQKPVFHIKI